MHPKCCGQAHNISQTDVAFTALDTAHVRAMDSGQSCQSFLAQSGSLAQGSLAIVCVILSVALYVVQISFKVLTTPWYMPILGSLGGLLLFVAVTQRPSLWRILSLLVFGGLAAFEWYFLLVFTRVPPYDGPVA